jgi:membrane protease YdiL (CAAX protease family)
MTRPPRLRSVVQRHQLAAYFGLTFSISWAIWLGLILSSLHIQNLLPAALNIVALAGPSISALVLAAVLGRGELGRLLAGFSRSRLSVRWTVAALVLPMAMMVAAIAVSVTVFGTPRHAVTFSVAGVVFAEFVRVLFLGGPVEEELGWRGFALPRLQQHRNALDASILLGLVWGFWHLPLYFVLGTGQSEMLGAGASPGFAIGGFIGWTIGLSVLFTWLFNQTAGSLIVVILFHGAVNLAAFLPTAVGSGGAAPVLNVVITWLVAILVVVRFGRARLVSPPRVEVATAQ